MATPNLGFIVPVESQASKSVTIANTLSNLDKATQGDTPLVITGATTVTADEFTLGFSLELSGTPGAPFNLTVPSTKRFFRVENGSDDAATVKTASGTTVVVAASEARLLYCDGANITEEGSSSGMTGVESQEGGTPVVSNTIALNFKAAEFDITDETASVTGIALADQSLETKVQRITTDQNFAASLTQCQWNDEVRDEFAGHDNSTDNEQIVIGTEQVDASAKIKLLNLGADETVDARIVRFNSSDVLQEVVARSKAEDNPEITLNAINIRGAAAGDYLVVDLLSADVDYDLDRSESYFLVRKAASGGGGGGATKMDELSDADTTAEAPVAGDYLAFNGSNWVPVPKISYCRVVNTGVSIADNANALISFTATDEIDTDSYHDTSTNPSRMIAPFTGEYEWILDVGVGVYNAATFVQCVLNLNRAGSTTFQPDDVQGSFLEGVFAGDANGRYKVRGSGIINLTATDYLELVFFQLSTASRDTRNIRFTLRYIGS